MDFLKVKVRYIYDREISFRFLHFMAAAQRDENPSPTQLASILTSLYS